LQLLDDLKERETILEIERSSKISQTVEKPFWKRLWADSKRDDGKMNELINL